VRLSGKEVTILLFIQADDSDKRVSFQYLPTLAEESGLNEKFYEGEAMA
jgi:hypothetical protein